MEKDRGISISSSALQFPYRDCVINLVDTPGHADFSEDTYRVLTAVDSAVMLLDAAKGMETQTMKLFEVCRSRRIPIITVINKWDRPGHEALALLDEIEKRTGMVPTPWTWPVGVAGDFHGVIEQWSDEFVRFTRTPGGSTKAIEERFTADEVGERDRADFDAAREELDLLAADGYVHDQELFLAQATTPVLFTAAVSNFGVGHLLDVVADMAPSPTARRDVEGRPRAVEAPFSAQVFKVQAGMDRAHRDRLAFARVCSGVFYRGDVITHAATGRSFTTKYVSSVFGRDRETMEEAFPGDIIGLVNAGTLRAGDTLYGEDPVDYPPIPSFAPEHFRVVRAADPSKHKQFQKGIEQLDQEGVVQVLDSESRSRQNADPRRGGPDAVRGGQPPDGERVQRAGALRSAPLHACASRQGGRPPRHQLGDRSGGRGASPGWGVARPADGEVAGVHVPPPASPRGSGVHQHGRRGHPPVRLAAHRSLRRAARGAAWPSFAP